MATYYHGTSEWRARAIEAEGFLGSELDELTIGRHVADGVVFLADSVELALGYGDTVIRVETDDAIYFQDCPVTGHKEYFVAVADLQDEGAWWVE